MSDPYSVRARSAFATNTNSATATRKSRRRRAFLVAAIASSTTMIVAGGSYSKASTLTYRASWNLSFSGEGNVPYPNGNSPDIESGLDWVNIEFPQFDTSLGTFNSDTIAAQGSFSFAWDFTHSNPADLYYISAITPFSSNGITNEHVAWRGPASSTGNFTYTFNKTEIFTTSAPYVIEHSGADRHEGITGGSSTGTLQGAVSLVYDYTPNSSISGSFSLGSSSGSDESYSHDGSTLTISDDLVVGDAGTATFTQSSGLITVQGNTILGKQSTGNGTYNLSSTGRLVTNNDLIVGKYGTGTFNQSGGTNTVSGTLRIAKETGSHGTYNLSGGLLIATNVVNNGSFNFTGGAASVSTLTGTGTTTVGSGRTLALSQARQGSLTVNGSVTVAANGAYAGTVIVGSLSVGGSGKLDLNDNDLIVNSGSFSTLQALVLGGYRASADTTATGIVSSTSQNVHGGTTILALFDNSLAGFSVWPMGSATTVASSAIIGKYTYIGDTNMDGEVNPQDYTAIDSNLNTSVDVSISWFYGDTNFDGNINFADYAGVDGALGYGHSSPLAIEGLASVPEPIGLAPLLVGSLLQIRRRRRRR
jgi:hypothetical protein